MADLGVVTALVHDTLERFDAPEVTLAAISRRCQRIASLRGDVANLFWLNTETMDLTMGPSDASDRREELQIGNFQPAERGRADAKMVAYMSRRAIFDNTANIWAGSIEEAESHLARVKAMLASFTAPEGMHPTDLGLRLIRQDEQRPKLIENQASMEKLITRTRAALWEFLIETEYALTFGEASAETFERLRGYVDQQLTVLSPSALEQFQSAYRRLKDGGNEERNQAVTSCRRVLKTLADELYPARDDRVRGIDGRERDMKDGNFVNRLVQYVAGMVGSHQNGPVVVAAVEDVGKRVAALNELANKGVHADIGEYEVDSCVVQTYLVVADVLRIREKAQTAVS